MRVLEALRTFFGEGWDCDAEIEAERVMTVLRDAVTPSEWRLEWNAAALRQEARSRKLASDRRLKAKLAARRRRVGEELT